MFIWTTGIDLVFFYDVLVQFGSFRTDVQWYAVVYTVQYIHLDDYRAFFRRGIKRFFTCVIGDNKVSNYFIHFAAAFGPKSFDGSTLD